MFPPAIQVLAFWRVLGGVAIGIASVIAPTYIAEVAPTVYRGRLASFQQLAIVLGITVSQLANYGLNQAAGGESTNRLGGIEAWQWMLGVETIPALVNGAMALAIPESPRHLIADRREEQAREVLRDVEGPDVDLDARVAERCSTPPASPAPETCSAAGSGCCRSSGSVSGPRSSSSSPAST
jgi:SP family sugar:H+ symporter-like MFS transporter